MNRILTFLLFLVISYTNSIADNIYKNYSFKMDKIELEKIEGIYDCTEEAGTTALCLDNQTFLDLETSTIFKFLDNKLIQVIVALEFEETKYVQLFKAIKKKFSLVALQNKDARFDMIDMMHNGTKSDLDKLTIFESVSLSKGNLTYIFLDKSNTQEHAMNVKNVTELIAKSNASLREVDFMIHTDEENESYILLSFSKPILTYKLINLLKLKDEDF